MKSALILIFFAALNISLPAHAQFGKWIKDAVKPAATKPDAPKKDEGKNNPLEMIKNLASSSQKPSLSEADISEGLKAALRIGAENATHQLSVQDGFFGNQLIKILMPEDAKKVETTLRKMGLGSKVDQLILSMNRAAEDASIKALDIFVGSIAHLSIDDGLKILKGPNDAATQYLKNTTTAALTEAFTPVIEESLGKVHAPQYWSAVFNTYNKIPFVKKVNPNLTAYVTERALNGVFVKIAEEEAKIRTSPAARVTEILKKVFN